MEAWVLILLIFIIIVIVVGIILLVYFVEKKKETPAPKPPPNPNPVDPGSRFKTETGLCTGTGTKWNIGGRSDADCAQACISNSASNATAPEGWTKCTGWDEISNEGAFSCILYDYPDIRGSGTNGVCNVLTS